MYWVRLASVIAGGLIVSMVTGMLCRGEEAEMFGNVNMDTVMDALTIMWRGMGGIFVTILIIMICVFVMKELGKTGNKKEEDME